MNKLIEKAKIRYPVGTKIKCVLKNREVIVNDDLSSEINVGNRHWYNSDEHLIIFCTDLHGTSILGEGFYLYSKGKWAEIIEPVNKTKLFKLKYFL